LPAAVAAIIDGETHYAKKRLVFLFSKVSPKPKRTAADKTGALRLNCNDLLKFAAKHLNIPPTVTNCNRNSKNVAFIATNGTIYS